MPVPPIPGLINGRHVPYLDGFRQLIAPPEDLAKLAAGWALLCNLRDGRIPLREIPGAVERACLTKKLDLYRDAAHLGAGDLERRRTVAGAMVDGAAHRPPISPHDEITTTQAASQYGLSDETWRRMAKYDDRIQARKTDRDVWLLSRKDVIAEMERRRGRGSGSGEGPDTPGPAGDPGGASGGSGSSRERAA